MDFRKAERHLSFVRSIVYRSLMESYMPLPVDREVCSRWATGLPKSGPTIIYTSYMYQLGSAFKSYARLLERFSGVKLASKFTFLGGYLVKPKEKELERGSLILNRITALLAKEGINVAYLYEEEPYSGALLLELGLLDEFREYGKKLLEFFQSRGIKRLVTVDPHTTNALSRMTTMLKSDLEVANYLQLIHPSAGSGTFVLHDSCLYSRYLGLGPAVRSALTEAGIALVDDRMVTAEDTSTCCGAPVESVDEEFSEAIAKRRAARLLSVHGNVLVTCPLCYHNLSPYVKSVQDIVEVIR